MNIQDIVIGALEQAAQICDAKHHTWRWGDGEESISGPKECAEAIRELKENIIRASNEGAE